jgi:hypothetical protein
MDNLRTLRETALQQMEQDRASAKRLTSYRSTGFGAIIRHCEELGCVNYDDEVIEKFIFKSRSAYESGAISRWTWQLIRRSGELLKHFQKNMTFDLPKCESWAYLHNPLRREPTLEELSDNNNIFVLVWRLKQEILKLELVKPATLNGTYQHYFYHILRSCF